MQSERHCSDIQHQQGTAKDSQLCQSDECIVASIDVDRAVGLGNSKQLGDSCGHTHCLEMPLAALVLQPDAAQVC